MQAARVTITLALAIQKTAIAQLGQCNHDLRSRKANSRGDVRPPGSRTQMEHGDIGLWILLIEQRDPSHVVIGGHGTLDRHADGHRVAVLDQRRDLELDLPGHHLGATGQRSDGSREFELEPLPPGARTTPPRARHRSRASDAARLRVWVSRISWPWVATGVLIAQRAQQRHHVLDLLGRQHRARLPRGAGARQPVDPVEATASVSPD